MYKLNKCRQCNANWQTDSAVLWPACICQIFTGCQVKSQGARSRSSHRGLCQAKFPGPWWSCIMASTVQELSTTTLYLFIVFTCQLNNFQQKGQQQQQHILPPKGMITTLCLHANSTTFTTSSWLSEKRKDTSSTYKMLEMYSLPANYVIITPCLYFWFLTVKLSTPSSWTYFSAESAGSHQCLLSASSAFRNCEVHCLVS